MISTNDDSLLTAIKATANAFRLGVEGQGNSQLAIFIDLLDEKMSSIRATSVLKLPHILESSLKAISRRDYLWAADLLEYEIMPLLFESIDDNSNPVSGTKQKENGQMINSNTLHTKTPSTPDTKMSFTLDWGVYAILQLLQDYQFNDSLDIGSGAGEHKRFLEFFGKKVFSVDILKNADYVGDFMEIEFDRQFDTIWCSHVLEHQRNIGFFLDKIYDTLKNDGILAITVPIHPRERLISGHLSSWSIPLLCYNLIMAGFDCKEARIIETFELSIIVQKRPAKHKELRKTSAHGADAGVEFSEIEDFFPFDARQGAEICGPGTINWDNITDYSLPAPIQPGISAISIKSKNFNDEPDLIPVIKINNAVKHER